MNKKPYLVIVSVILLACMALGTPTIEPPIVPGATEIQLTSESTAAPPPTTDGPSIANCLMFPADNFWNARVDSLPTHQQSSAWIESIGSAESFHLDFGSGEWDGGPIGIPYNIISGFTLDKYTVDFYYPDESDAGPYPIPDNPNIEYGSDHHILLVDTDTCTLY
ncbi:MAG TPA: hypothetical protein VJ022_08125, partial [Anaerolineales bacterium]|nr:hypothetical protein [Anaerolineales bacterium]